MSWKPSPKADKADNRQLSEIKDSEEMKEELDFQLEKVALSLTQVYNEIAPLADKMKKIADSVEENVEFIKAWNDMLKHGSEIVPVKR